MGLKGEVWNQRLQVVKIQREIHENYNLKITEEHEELFRPYLLGVVDDKQFKEIIMILRC